MSNHATLALVFMLMPPAMRDPLRPWLDTIVPSSFGNLLRAIAPDGFSESVAAIVPSSFGNLTGAIVPSSFSNFARTTPPTGAADFVRHFSVAHANRVPTSVWRFDTS